MSPCPTGTYSYKIKFGDSLWLIAQRSCTTIQAITALNPGIDANNLHIGQIICIPQGHRFYQNSEQPLPLERISRAEEMLNNHMRMLWEQHIYWTRMVILSMAFDLPDTEFVTSRLLRNPKDFEAALSPFYGESSAAKFAELFTSHLTIAAELVKAAKVNNNAAAADAEKRWYANADQIAAFLGSINPYWSAQEWQRMLYDHLAMTKNEAVDILTKNYSDSITVFENIEREALAMADMMTLGIVRQFPRYFI